MFRIVTIVIVALQKSVSSLHKCSLAKSRNYSKHYNEWGGYKSAQITFSWALDHNRKWNMVCWGDPSCIDIIVRRFYRYISESR